MSTNVKLSRDGSFLIGRYSRDIDRDVALEIGEKYVTMMRESGVKLILDDVRGCKSLLGTIGCYELVYRDVIDLGFPKDIKLAMLVDDGDNSHDFLEVAGEAAGFNVMLFYSYNNAVDWLLQQTETQKVG